MSSRVTPPTEPAREVALRMLTARRLTESELRERLARRGHAAADIDNAVAAMARYGYVDDDALASTLATGALGRGRGPGWVRATLMRRGVRSEAALAAAAEGVDAAAAVDAACALVQRRFARVLPNLAADRAVRAKVYNFLCRRGFSHDCVRAALERATACPQDLET